MGVHGQWKAGARVGGRFMGSGTIVLGGDSWAVEGWS